MKRTYAWLWLFTLAGACFAAYFYNRPSCGIRVELTQIHAPCAPTHPDLIWILDEEGSLFQQDGHPLWPDQLAQLLHDESRNHHPKIELRIDRRSRFESLAPILALCSNYGATLQLTVQSPTKDQTASRIHETATENWKEDGIKQGLTQPSSVNKKLKQQKCATL